jgi:hypothetical protein
LKEDLPPFGREVNMPVRPADVLMSQSDLDRFGDDVDYRQWTGHFPWPTANCRHLAQSY